MAQEGTARVVSTANQIAANLAAYPDGVARTADHFRRFWAPSLRAALVDHLRAGGEGLSDVASSAARQLADEAEA